MTRSLPNRRQWRRRLLVASIFTLWANLRLRRSSILFLKRGDGSTNDNRCVGRSTSTTTENSPSSKYPSSARSSSSSSNFTIVILSSVDGGPAPLQRLVGRLNATDYHYYPSSASSGGRTTADNNGTVVDNNYDYDNRHPPGHVSLWIHFLNGGSSERDGAAASAYDWARRLTTATAKGDADDDDNNNNNNPSLSSDAIPLQPSFGRVRVMKHDDDSVGGASKGRRYSQLSWLDDTYVPASDDERIVILNDTMTLSPLWHAWIQGVIDRYGNGNSDAGDDNIAGFNLERMPSSFKLSASSSSPSSSFANEGRPFLYPPILGTGGAFAPRATVWRDFVEWMRCSSCLGINGNVTVVERGESESATTTTTTPPWVKYFAKFADHHGLYSLYHPPRDRGGGRAPSLTLAMRRNTDGTSDASSDFELVADVADLKLAPPSSYCDYRGHYEETPLVRYDLDMNPVVETLKNRKFVVITAAVGELYRTVAPFETFVGSLRRYYRGPVSMLVGNQTPVVVTDYLSSMNVQYETTEEGRSWTEFNVFRFGFYDDACSLADWCLAVDMRDVKFQSNPFPSNLFAVRGAALPAGMSSSSGGDDEGADVDVDSDVDSYVFAHNLVLNKHLRGGRWFHKNLPGCGSFRDREVPSRYASLINAGGFYATPRGLDVIRSYVAEHAECNDQIAFNMLVHSRNNDTERPTLKRAIFPQGYGPVNNVAFSSSYTLDTMGRIGGWDCFLSPVVHQYDRLFQSRLMNDNC